MIGLNTAKGTVGPAGVEGATGVAGANGAIGVAGASGATGATGAAGATGATGATGGELDLTLANQTGDGWTITGTVNESVTPGTLLSMGNNGKWAKSNESSANAMPAAGIALEAASGDGDVDILIFGLYRDDSLYNWTPGAILYVDNVDGAIAATAPGDSGDLIQVVGIAITADIILFNPDYTLMELV